MTEIEGILDKQVELLEQVVATLQQPGSAGFLPGDNQIGVQSFLQAVRDALADLKSVPASVPDGFAQEASVQAGQVLRQLEANAPDVVSPAMADSALGTTGAGESAATRNGLIGVNDTPAHGQSAGTEAVEGLLLQLHDLGNELLQAAWAIHNKVQPGGAG